MDAKKNFGPTDPLTGEEKKQLTEEIAKLKAKYPNAHFVASENVIGMQDMLRDMIRQLPPVEEMQNAISELDRVIKGYQDAAGDFVKLGFDIDAKREEITNDQAKLDYQKRITGATAAISIVFVIFAFLLMRSGFRDWARAEEGGES